jgi:molybdopterin-binding protein
MTPQTDPTLHELHGRIRPDRTMAIRNKTTSLELLGTIRDIAIGPLTSEVQVVTHQGVITSIVTSRALAQLKLRSGDEIRAIVNPGEVCLVKRMAAAPV